MSVVPFLEQDIWEYFVFNLSTVPRIGDLSGSWIGLCSASPGESGTTTNELTNIGNRKFLDDAPWGSASANQITWPNDISWTPTGSGAATYFLLGDSTTVNSTHDFYDPLATTVNYIASDPLRIRGGQLSLTIGDLWGYQEGNKLLDALVGGESPTNFTGTIYFALSTTAPNPDGTNVTEPSVGAYARASFSVLASLFSASGSSPRTLTSTSNVIWPQATASWGTVSHWACYDLSTGGNLLYYGALTSSEEVINGLQPRFAVGDLVWTLD